MRKSTRVRRGARNRSKDREIAIIEIVFVLMIIGFAWLAFANPNLTGSFALFNFEEAAPLEDNLTILPDIGEPNGTEQTGKIIPSENLTITPPQPEQSQTAPQAEQQGFQPQDYHVSAADFTITSTADFDAGTKSNVQTETNDYDVGTGQIKLLKGPSFVDNYESTDEQDVTTYDASYSVSLAGSSTAKIDTAQYYSNSSSLRMYMDAVGSDDWVIRSVTAKTTGTVYVALRCDTENDGVNTILRMNDASSNFLFQVGLIHGTSYYSGNRRFFWYGAGLGDDTGVSWNKDTWYVLKITWNSAAGTFSAWVSGGGYTNQVITTSGTYYGGSTANVGEFRYRVLGNGEGGSYNIWWDNMAYGATSYATTGNWTSATQTMPATYKMGNTTVNYAGVNANNYIDKIEWLVGGVVKATYDTDITSDSSKTIANGDLTSGAFSDVNANFTVKTYLVGNGTNAPLVSEISGNYESGGAANQAPQVNLNLPGNNAQINNTQSVNFNFTATDDQNTTFSCDIYLDSALNQTNSSAVNNTLTNFLINGISYGSHNWAINCTDGSLSNVFSTRYFSINDTQVPQYSGLNFNPANSSAYSPGQNYMFNATWTDNIALSKVILEFNGQNYTDASNYSNEYYKTFSSLPVGNFSYRWYANDTSNNWNATISQSYSITKTPTYVNLSLNGAENNITLTYPQTIKAIFSTNALSATMYRNGTSVSAENDTEVTLAAGYWNYTVINPGTANYTGSSKTFFVTISKQATAVDLYLNENLNQNVTIAYGTQSNVTAVGTNGSVALYRNETTVGTQEITTLAAGYWNYTAIIPDDENKTGSSKTYFLTIEKASDVVTLYINEAQSNASIIYGTQSNATAVSLSGTEQLFRNNIAVGNPEITTLAADTYQYIANSTGNENYTAGADVTYYLEINRTTSSVNLLLNSIDDDITVNQTQSVNITGFRITGEGSLELYEDGNSIGGGPSPLANITSYSSVGSRNITLMQPQTQNYTASNETHFVNVMGILSAALTEPQQPPPILFEGLDITFNASITDEFGNPVTDADVTFEPINDTTTYLCPSTVNLGDGNYSCALNTGGMIVPAYYNVRVNASKGFYYNISTTSNNVFYLAYNHSASLMLAKIPSVSALNATHITYNITLLLDTSIGVSENTLLNDIDGAIVNENKGTINSTGVIESYFLTYIRTSSDQTIALSKANASGYDPIYGNNLFVESNFPSIIVPRNTTEAQLTLIKNLAYVNQTTTNITYTIVDTVVNSGGQDLAGIAIVDSDIELAETADLAKGQSITYSGNKTINKNSQSFTQTFVKASAFALGNFYYSNQPLVQIPGYGGPYDVIIESLPDSVTAGSDITGTVKAVNMNSEISEDRTLTTWIEDAGHNIYDLDVRTIFVGRNISATTSVTLTAPAAAGTYYFISELAWPTATANATKSFEVTSGVPQKKEAPSGGVGGGAVGVNVTVPAVPANITVPSLPGEVPQDIRDSLIELRNTYSDIQKDNADLDYLIQAAEDAAAQGRYDLARNLIQTAIAKLDTMRTKLEKNPLLNLPAVNVSAAFSMPNTSTLVMLAIIFGILAFIVKRRGGLRFKKNSYRKKRKDRSDIC